MQGLFSRTFVRSLMNVRENILRTLSSCGGQKQETCTGVWEIYSESMLIANVVFVKCTSRRLMNTSQVSPLVNA